MITVKREEKEGGGREGGEGEEGSDHAQPNFSTTTNDLH
jgi:hypothetical protein